ncbi:DNA topoisomerase [Staphylococcus gallinarum]|uniref:DNA topoisomerase n=1 Tax=Staphylococcus gallinarum TaxID=1293 RepID=UPI001E6052B7|nr:DNA topoisomerase [Staphylococcus gallinarum]MCD8845170.1 hypothetical protein [Staphylococcus gallinarum]
MVNWLIFAEKQDQAKKIADVIFDKKKPTGSFNEGGLGGQNLSSILNGEVRIVHFKGHLYEMEMPPQQDDKYNLKSETKTNRFGMKMGGETKSIEDVFPQYPINLNLDKIKWKIKSDGNNKTATNRKIVSNMKKLYNNADNIIVATDFDNEGEMIFRNWQQLNISKPKWDSLYRAKMNSTTPKEISAAFQNLIPYKASENNTLHKMYAQGFARSIADYEYGLSFTFYGWMYANKFNTQRGQYGRLKNSLLGVVYQQEIEHDNFKPSSNYRIDMVLPNGDILQGDESMVFKTKQECEKYIDNQNLPNEVAITYKEEKVEKTAPKLYSRNELLVALMKKHENKLAKNDTWNTHLQSLYERHSLLSYPRTDVQYISKEVYKTLQELVQTESVQLLLKQQIKRVVTENDIKSDISFNPNKEPETKHVNEKKLEGESHFALIPTDKEPSNFSQLAEAEKVVYFEDLMRTMAIFANPSITIKRYYEGHGHFKATQSKTLTHGYRILLDNISEDSGQFPDEAKYHVQYKATEVKAKRPSLFTKMSLTSMTKRVNWGTSATRDATIEELINKNSLILDKKYLRINPNLKNTISTLLDKGLIDFEMTSEWQEQLDKLHSYDDALSFINSTRNDTQNVHDTFKVMLK